MFCANFVCTAAGSSLKEPPLEVLQPLSVSLLAREEFTAALMVIDAALLGSPGVAWLHYVHGLAQAYRHNFGAAMQSLATCFQLGGGDANSYTLYGRLVGEFTEDKQSAMAYFSKALQLTSAPDQQSLTMEERANVKFAMADHQGALQDYEQSNSIVPLTGDSVRRFAELHSTVGDVTTAVSLFDRAAGIDPSNGRIFQQRGACKTTLGNYAGSVADLTTAIQLGRDDSKSYVYRGIANMKLKCLAAALADLSQALVLNPENDEAFAFRAEVKSLMGDHRGAVEDMDSAHLIQPLTSNDRNNRAHHERRMHASDVDVAADAEAAHCAATPAATSVVSYGVNSATLATTPAADFSDGMAASDLYSLAHRKRVDGDLQGALAVLDQEAQLQPKDGKIFLERASVKMEVTDYLGALQDLDVVDQLGGITDRANVLKMRSLVNSRLGNKHEALYFMDQAVLLQPRNGELLQQRGAIKSDLQDWRGALADVEAALEHGTKTSVSFRLRGSIHCMLGNESKALIDLNMADLLCSNDVETFTWRACVKSDVGDYQGAIEDFDRAALLQVPDEHSMDLRAQAVRLLSIISPDGETLNEAVVDKADPQEVSADLFALAIAWHKRGKFAGVLTVIDAIPLPERVPNVAGMAKLRRVCLFELGKLLFKF